LTVSLEPHWAHARPEKWVRGCVCGPSWQSSDELASRWISATQGAISASISSSRTSSTLKIAWLSSRRACGDACIDDVRVIQQLQGLHESLHDVAGAVGRNLGPMVGLGALAFVLGD
jgi:hypothetical protein